MVWVSFYKDRQRRVAVAYPAGWKALIADYLAVNNTVFRRKSDVRTRKKWGSTPFAQWHGWLASFR